MKDEIKLVRDFQEKVKSPLDLKGMDSKVLETRMKILIEEVKELADASEGCSKAFNVVTVAHMLKELGDVQCAVIGFAETFGLPLTDSFNEVMKSNMTKDPTNETGKAIKGEGYVEANLIPEAVKVVSRVRGFLIDSGDYGLD